MAHPGQPGSLHSLVWRNRNVLGSLTLICVVRPAQAQRCSGCRQGTSSPSVWQRGQPGGDVHQGQQDAGTENGGPTKLSSPSGNLM